MSDSKKYYGNSVICFHFSDEHVKAAIIECTEDKVKFTMSSFFWGGGDIRAQRNNRSNKHCIQKETLKVNALVVYFAYFIYLRFSGYLKLMSSTVQLTVY